MAIFYNQATLTYSGGVVTSNITVGELLSALAVSKTAIVDEYSQNSDVTYAVNIINSGTTAFSDLTLTDNLGAYPFGNTTLTPLDYVSGSVTYFVNGVLQTAPNVTDSSPLIITGIDVPAGGVATILYTVSTNSFAPLAAESTIENTITVSGGCADDITATETITVESGSDLTITKFLSPTAVVCGDEITYTFLIQNFGNEAVVATDNVVVTDTFNPILNDITVTYNGNPWTSPANYTYDEATGLFQTVPGAITVPAATYVQDAVTGEWEITPGTATLVVTGTV